MRRISVSNCEPGMILGKTIIHNGSVILLETGTKLTSSYIDRLKNLGISEIYIDDKSSQDIVINDVVIAETRAEAIQFMKNTMNSYSSLEMIDSQEAMAVVEKILDDIFSLDDIVVNLMDIKTCDNYTFSHSVNVCILSVLTGTKLKLDYVELKELGVGALLHDIGKVMIPPEILQKEDTLSDDEYEIIKQHSLLGYNILKNVPHISEKSALVALNHHERYDGNGYPNGLVKEEIHIYSKIVAITDMFDALTSDRIYRKKINTYQALEYFTRVIPKALDSKVLSSFLLIIPPFPVGSWVLLNTGEKGLVIKQNENLPAKPVIRIIYDSNGNKKFIFNEINLAEIKDWYIVSPAEIGKVT